MIINNSRRLPSIKVDSAKIITIRITIRSYKTRLFTEIDNAHCREQLLKILETTSIMGTKTLDFQNLNTCRLDKCERVIIKSKPTLKKDRSLPKFIQTKDNLLHLIWLVNQCNSSQLICIIHKRCNKAASPVKFTLLKLVTLNIDNLLNHSLMKTSLTQTIMILTFKTK